VGVRYPSLALRPDKSIVSGFVKYLKNNAHPVYGEMMRLISSIR
jgi:hypothetical protein